jgi:hypothetical protein
MTIIVAVIMVVLAAVVVLIREIATVTMAMIVIV